MATRRPPGIGINEAAERELSRLYREHMRIIDRITKQLLRELPGAAKKAGVERVDSVTVETIEWELDRYSVLDGVDAYAMVIPEIAARTDGVRTDRILKKPLSDLVAKMENLYKRAAKKIEKKTAKTVRGVADRIDVTAQERLARDAKRAGDIDVSAAVKATTLKNGDWLAEQERLLSSPPRSGSKRGQPQTLIERHANAIRAIVFSISLGVAVETAAKRIASVIGITRRRSDMIAEDQALREHAAALDALAKEADIEKYMWVSRRDNRVRLLHRERDGNIYNSDHVFREVPLDGPPGVPPNCRCRRSYLRSDDRRKAIA